MNKHNIPQSVLGFTSISDTLHPLAGLSSITEFRPDGSIEEDIKRKGPMSEIIQRLTRLETAVRKLQAKS